MNNTQHTPTLSIKQVSVSYGDNKVINELDLDVFHGETFGLMGLNGVGKTTLIKAVLGLRECDSGELMIDGLDGLHPDSKKSLSYLPERFEPPWFLSGMEFLKFSVSLYSQPFDKEYVFEMSERLALDPSVLGSRVQTYSKGMRQKLGILSVILTQCPLLILDEPMSGLDPKARTFVKDVLLEAKGRGRTIFLSSHILSDMNEICDRVAVLSGGTLVFTGTPDELKHFGGNDNLERAFLNVIEPETEKVA